MSSTNHGLVPIGSIRGVPRARHHVLSVLVENKAGVLARVAQLFSRRAYNIFSLAVAPTEDERFSRITIVVDVDSSPLEQITKQLHKLINVIKISEIDPVEAVEFELLLASVEVTTEQRSNLVELATIFGAKIVDVGFDRLTVMLADPPDKLDDFEDLLRQFKIVEVQRTGRVALAKLDRVPPNRARSQRGKAS